MAYRQFILALVALATATANFVVAAPAVPKPIVTNKTRFRIPFRFDAQALERMNARELRLYVSQDQGQNWELTQTIGTDSGKFEFQAPGDGEYRFAVKTLDNRNQLHPPGDSFETGLVVIVDSVTPQLELEVRQTTPGKVELRWRAIDANIDLTTLKLEYTQPGVEDWQSVSIAPKAAGQTAWSVATGGVVSVRGVVADAAGNQGRGQHQANIAPSQQGNNAPRKPDLRQPIAESPGQPQLTEHFSEVPHPYAVPVPSQKSAHQSPQQPVVEREPVIISSRTHFTADQSGNRPAITQNRWSDVTDPGAGQIPPGARSSGRHRVVNTKKFQIGYKVDDVGPSGLGGVELFITQDQGRKWWKYGEDTDQQSPFDVEVPDDGEFGFAIRARSGVGLAIEPPAPNEEPAIIVVVDQTPPAVELLPVRQGLGEHVNQLQLRWRISEAHPAETPVAVFYAASPNGPWEPITSWIADQGEHVLTVNPGMPSQLYFRVAVRDAAGNVGHEQTARPVIVDLKRPTARIVDIEAPQHSGPQ